MAQTNTTSLWVQLYFVLSSLLGLILASIGMIMILNVILTQTIWKVPDRPSYGPPPEPALTRLPAPTEGELTDEQKEMLAQWEKDYQRWQEEDRSYNYEEANRKRQIANGVALLITGLPILFAHAPWVFKKAA